MYSTFVSMECRYLLRPAKNAARRRNVRERHLDRQSRIQYQAHLVLITTYGVVSKSHVPTLHADHGSLLTQLLLQLRLGDPIVHTCSQCTQRALHRHRGCCQQYCGGGVAQKPVPKPTERKVISKYNGVNQYVQRHQTEPNERC